VGDITGAGAKKVAEGKWESADGVVKYAFIAVDGGPAGDLYITIEGKRDQVIIRNWRPDKNLGITLDDAAPATPTLPSTVIGDIAKLTNGDLYDTSSRGYASAGAQANAADVLLGTTSGDDMRGLGGNDGLAGDDGDDLIDGGAGSDLIFGGTGADTLNGGAEADFIYGSAVGTIARPTRVDFTPPTVTDVEAARGFSWVASRADKPRLQDNVATLRYVTLTGADAAAVFTGAGGLAYVESSGNVIDGGAGDDYIAAGTGSDVVHGGADNDDLIGMRGNDLLFGDAGDDIVFGDGNNHAGSPEYTAPEYHGDDTLVGGAGNDVVAGQGGADELYGGADNDMLWGDDMDPETTPNAVHGNDYLDGGDGTDRMSGGGADDTLVGAAGADSMWGDGSTREAVKGSYHGTDELQGGDGNDEIHGGGKDDVLEGGNDNDRLWGDDDTNDTIDAAFHGRDYLDGGNGADYLEGGGKDDELFGGNGNDSIFGDGDASRGASIVGRDYVDGEDGNDSLFGGSDRDTVFGGDGDDSLYGDFGEEAGAAGTLQGDDYLDGEKGNDALVGNGGNDTLYGSAGNDTLWGDATQGEVDQANDGADVMRGDEGNDVLFGQGGDDTLAGGKDNDSLMGGSGNDQLSGDGGNDTLFGQAGNDSLGGAEGVDYLDGGDGNDTLFGGSEADTLYGQAGNDVLHGENGNDFMGGGAGNDQLAGGAGADNLLGDAGNDQLNGDADNDQILGGEGDDTLSGGAGADYLDGGAGNDTYIVSLSDMASSGGYIDRIVDTQGKNILVLAVSGEQVALDVDSGSRGAVRLRIDADHELGVSAATRGGIAAVQFADGSSISMNRLIGERYALQVEEAATTDGVSLMGGVMDDQLAAQGAAAGVTLSGGRGTDKLQLDSTQGSTILYSIGDGLDYVTTSLAEVDRGGSNVIKFGEGISATDIRLTLNDNGLRLMVGSRDSDQILLTNARSANMNVSIDRVDFADGSSLTMDQLLARGFDGSDGYERLFGTVNGDRVSGNGGNDEITTLAGDDSLTGGAGDDSLSGGTGDDTYFYDRNTGNDVVREELTNGGNDTLVLGQGVTHDDVILGVDGTDLIVTIDGTADKVRVDGYFAGAAIESIRFSDGSVWDSEAIASRIVNELTTRTDSFVGTDAAELLSALAGNDTVTALGGADTIDGGEGNDVLNAGDGNDLIDGGAGDDVLTGGNGSDTYLFGYGSGRDTLDDRAGPTVLRFGPGVSPADVQIQDKNFEPWRSFVVSLGNSTDQITFVSGNGAVHSFENLARMEFADGTVWLKDDWQRRILDGRQTEDADTIVGYESDDVILGLGGNDFIGGQSGNDTLNGGAGRDTLLGDEGNDTLIHGEYVEGGRGDDTYVMASDGLMFVAPTPGLAPSGFDTLVLPDGVKPSDVSLASSLNPVTKAYDDLAVRIRGITGWALIEKFLSKQGTENSIEAIRFADGTVWGLEAIFSRVDGRDEHDSLVGGDGRDTLQGNGGDDTLDGGAGNDRLEGGRGGDTYLFGLAGGQDYVQESNSPSIEIDTVSLASGVRAEDVTLQRDGDDLVVILKSGADQLRVLNHFNASGDSAVERIVFADGTSWDAAEIVARTPIATVDTMTGTVNDDSYQVDSRHDQINEAANGGTDSVTAVVGYKLPDNVENLTLAGLLGASLDGNALNNSLTGNAGNNVFNYLSYAQANGSDTMAGGRGDDVYYVNGSTRYDSFGANDVVREAEDEGLDAIASNTFGFSLPEHVEVLVDRYAGGTWTNEATGVYERLLAGNSLNNVIAVIGGGGSVVSTTVSVLSLGAEGVMDKTNLGGSVRIDGEAGADTMIGSSDNSTYVVDDVDDVVYEAGKDSHDAVESSVSYVLGARLEDLLLVGDQAIAGTGNALDNRLDGSANAAGNVLTGGTGNDTYVLGAGDSFIEAAGEGNDEVVIKSGTAGATYSIGNYANIEALTLDFSTPYDSNAGATTLIGTDGDDVLANLYREDASPDGTEGRGGRTLGGAGNDSLRGGTGHDTLDGGSGADVMQGGIGNDIYVVDDVNDRVDEGARLNWWSPHPGLDTVETQVDYATPENVELLVAKGGVGLLLKGNSGGTSFDGSRNAAADTLDGGLGDDTYTVDAADIVLESVDGGYDRVVATASYTMGDNVEEVTLLDGASGALVGNATDNRFYGNAGSNVIGGMGGDDILYGSWGDDSLDGGEGADQLSGDDGDDALTGAAGNDTLDGDVGNDVLSGGAGNDTYVFGLSQGQDVIDNRDVASAVDTLIVHNISEADVRLIRIGQDLTLKVRGQSDAVTFTGYYTTSSENGEVHDGKIDAIQFQSTGTVWDQAQIDAMATVNRAPVLSTLLADQSAGQDIAFSHVVPADSFSDPDANDVLSYSATLTDGSPLPSWLTFNATTRTFSGTPSATGVSTIAVTVRDESGLSTTDTFDLTVTIQDVARTGTPNADVLTGGAGNDTLTGLGGNDRLSGGRGNDVLDGGTGNDTMVGGAGDDTYVMSASTDVVTELVNEGTDTVQAAFTFTLLANVENLALIGNGAINGTGNTLNNMLSGNSSANVLDGGKGADTLAGGAGDDIYLIDSAADMVTENAGEGTDSVQATTSWTLGANVENLTLTRVGGGDSATGNALNNVLTGTSGANRIDGGAGTDSMIGGAGNDTYVVDTTGDVVVEAVGEGTDTVESSMAYTLGANLENLTLTGTGALTATGNTLANVLRGNAGNNVLDGGAGADTMYGGTGDDVFRVDNVGDVINERVDEGTDRVEAVIDYTLGITVENLTLSGSSAINGTGNSVANILVGNAAANKLDGAAGDDTLDGGAGADTLIGGRGNDVFVVDNAGDSLTENAAEGTDTVRSSVGWTLGANLENLSLIGTASINGTGNAVANVLSGNTGNNVLTGLAGADTLDGGAGIDTLNGGAGADTYLFARGHGQDTVQDNDATSGVKDKVQFAAGIAQADLTYSHVGNNLEALINGTSDKLVFQDWYLGNQYHVEEFRFSDGTVLTDSQVQGLVSAMAGFNAPTSGIASAASMRQGFQATDLAVSSLM
jgi:Ca2+-binding RTX toxin-like protein